MQRFIIAVLMLSLAVPVYAGGQKPSNKPMTENEKALYAIGLVLARQLEVFDLSPAELRMVKRGINDATKGKKPKVDFALYSKKSQELATARRDAHGKKLASKVADFMAKEEEKEGAVKTASGLIYQSLREGQGTTPTLSDKIKVHYRSTLIDGKEMESTYKVGEPDELVLKEFMKCLVEGVQMMSPGGKARMICPPEIALGKEGSGIIPPDATLVFEVELLEVVK
jgi:FKBP-type peptidyl-prolyl cis-trans isomerase FkpA